MCVYIYIYIYSHELNNITISSKIKYTTTCFGPVCRQSSGCPNNLLSDYTICVVILEGGRDLVLHHTYLFTPWCRVLLEKLTRLQLVKKFPAFHGTRRFITTFTSVRHLSLSWASPIQSIYPHPTSWRSIRILSTHLRLGLPSGLFLSGFPTKTLYSPSPHPHAPHAQPISFFSILSPAKYWVRSTNYLAPRYAISSSPWLPRPS